MTCVLTIDSSFLAVAEAYREAILKKDQELKFAEDMSVNHELEAYKVGRIHGSRSL